MRKIENGWLKYGMFALGFFGLAGAWIAVYAEDKSRIAANTEGIIELRATMQDMRASQRRIENKIDRLLFERIAP